VPQVMAADLNSAAIAQEDDGGPTTQGDDAKYVSVTYTQYKPGKRERAIEIINEHFITSAKLTDSRAKTRKKGAAQAAPFNSC